MGKVSYRRNSSWCAGCENGMIDPLQCKDCLVGQPSNFAKRKPPAPPEETKYERETVVIQDKLLEEMSAQGNLIAVGVGRRRTEIHLAFYFAKLLKNNVTIYHHRDIEVQPNGNYDSGSMMESDDIKAELKRLGVLLE